MSQQATEPVIGRLASDEGSRERFAENRAAVSDELIRNGTQLTPVARRAPLGIDSQVCEEFAERERLDPRIHEINRATAHGWSSPPPAPAPLNRDEGTAELRDLVVFVDGRGDSAGTLEFAASLAEEHGAHLTGVFIQPEPAVSRAAMFARGKAMKDVIEALDAERRGIEADHRHLFERVAAGHGIRAEWRVTPRFTTNDAAVHARYGDLAVVARHDPVDPRGGHPGPVESLVLTSGRPTIVLPPRCATCRVRRVLVGWNARREAARAVADALPLLVRAEAVAVLAVDSDDSRRGHGQEPGADIARHLARHGTNVDVRRLSSGGEDVGRLLLSQAEAFRADLLVMGAYGHSRLTEWVFGGVTRTVLSKARLPVLTSR